MPMTPPKPEPGTSLDAVDIEEIAAEFMLHEGEVVFRDQCDLLDEFTDADLADQLGAVWAERIGEVDFERLITAFAKLSSEDGATSPSEYH